MKSFPHWRGMTTSGVGSLWDEMLSTNLSEQLLVLVLPV